MRRRNKLRKTVFAPIPTAIFQSIMSIAKPPSEFRLSESDVQAYADGMLDPERTASVQSYLKDRPDEAQRVAFYGRINQQMQNAFHDSPDELPSPKLAPRVSKRRITKVLIAAAAALVLVGGGFFAFDISDSALDNASMMALEQAVAAQDMATGASAYVSSAKALADAPNLYVVGFHPVARREMSVGPFASATEYVYRNAMGEAAVLLVAPGIMAKPQPQWKAHRVGETRLLAWASGGKRYVLAGRANTRGLMRAADLMTGN
jgi:anti-sigma factor RsiW